MFRKEKLASRSATDNSGTWRVILLMDSELMKIIYGGSGAGKISG